MSISVAIHIVRHSSGAEAMRAVLADRLILTGMGYSIRDSCDVGHYYWRLLKPKDPESKLLESQMATVRKLQLQGAELGSGDRDSEAEA